MSFHCFAAGMLSVLLLGQENLINRMVSSNVIKNHFLGNSLQVSQLHYSDNCSHALVMYFIF